MTKHRSKAAARPRRSGSSFLAGLGAVGTSLALAVLLAPGQAAADAVAPVAPASAADSQGPEFLARVDHEVVRRQANGITRIERWQETMARAGRTVWIERILPARAGLAGHEGHAARGDHDHPDDHGHSGDHDHSSDHHHSDDHDHSNDRGHAGHAHHDQAIRGHGHRHFDGDAAARWLIDKSDGWTHRVLWSDALQLALQIDSRRDDGTLTRSVRVELAAAATEAPATEAPAARALPQAWPWQRLAGYERRRYDEYLD